MTSVEKTFVATTVNEILAITCIAPKVVAPSEKTMTLNPAAQVVHVCRRAVKPAQTRSSSDWAHGPDHLRNARTVM